MKCTENQRTPLHLAHVLISLHGTQAYYDIMSANRYEFQISPRTSCSKTNLTLLQADLQAELQALYQMPRSPAVEQQKAAVRQELQSLR